MTKNTPESYDRNNHSQHRTAKTPDSIRIAYQISGNGPALVCCHPMASDQSLYDLHRDTFSRNHTLITFDQRGAGDSDHPPFAEGPDNAYTIERFGNDLKAVLDDAGFERASILGFSMGAIPALSFATRWPERVEKLILASAMASRLPQPIIDRARLVEDMLDEKGVDATYDFYFSGDLFETLMEDDSARTQIARYRAKATIDGFKGCFRVTIDRPSMIEQLHIIHCPTLILVGETDIHYLAEAELLEKKIKNAKSIVMPNVGHPMAAQDPEAFETVVMTFLE